MQIVPGLQGLVAGQALVPGQAERLGQARGGVVRGPDGAHLAGLDQLAEGAERLLQRRVGIVRMRLVEIDPVRAQALQRAVDRLHHVGAGQALALPGHLHAELGGDHHLVATPTALGQPAADHALGFPARVAGDPEGIDVRRVDQVEAMVHEGVEQGEARALVGCPSEHIAPERPGGDLQSRAAQFLSFHCVPILYRRPWRSWLFAQASPDVRPNDRTEGDSWAR